jgi:chromate transport protein ChrA
MRRLFVLLAFIIAPAVIVAAYGVVYAGWGDLPDRSSAVLASMGSTLVLFLFLAVMGLLDGGRDRWLAWLLASILLLGFSGVLFDVGLVFIAPFAIFLIIYSLVNLRRSRRDRDTLS